MSSAPSSRSLDLIIAALLFTGSLILRMVWSYHTHAPTLDTAVVGLMALEIQEGARPMFFSGQGYMGALEAYLTAFVFELWKADRFTMTLVPSLFGAIWPTLMYALFRVGGYRSAPAIAGAMLVAFPPGISLWYTSVPYGGYPEMYVFGTGLILHALLRTTQDRINPFKDALIFSPLLFLGVWTNLQIFPFLAAASVLWLRLLWQRRRTPRFWYPFALAIPAFAAAFVPQLVISSENPSSPPLFSTSTGTQIGYSVQAMWSFDIPKLMVWGSSEQLPDWTSITPYLALFMLGTVAAIRVRSKATRSLLAVSCLFLVFFSLVYFPHPMSGFVPRYLIAPFLWASSLAATLAVSSSRGWLRGLGWFVWCLWLAGQAVNFPASMDARRTAKDRKVQEIQEVIRVAREKELEVLRFVGSGMEGHRAAAFSFEAKNDPVFISSYDERRRKADLLWHRSSRAGYFFTESYDSFIQGSMVALHLPPPVLHAAGRFRVMPMPDAGFLPTNRLSLKPEEVNLEMSTGGPGRLRVDFATPQRVSGVRFTTSPGYSLPYQIRVQAGRPDGTTIEVHDIQKRLGTSYRGADRVYFKGLSEIGDTHWAQLEASWLEVHWNPGRLNKLPLHIETVDLLTSAPPESEPDWNELADLINTHPDLPVRVADPLGSWLLRSAPDPEAPWVKRLPLPWNPRDPQAQPAQGPIDLEKGMMYLTTDPGLCHTLSSSFSFPPERHHLGPFVCFVFQPQSSPAHLYWQYDHLRTTTK